MSQKKMGKIEWVKSSTLNVGDFVIINPTQGTPMGVQVNHIGSYPGGIVISPAKSGIPTYLIREEMVLKVSNRALALDAEKYDWKVVIQLSGAPT